MELVTYLPQDCNHSQCKSLVSYVRLDISKTTVQRAVLQFMTTIFTGLVIVAGALMFADDTQKIVIVPITKMVSIIKTLADDPLQKPEKPVIDEHEVQSKGNHMKTAELQKTIFRIGNLLQMSFGQLGASVIKENSSQGDGNFEIMIPGHRVNVIFMVCKINHYVELADGLKGHITQFLNRIVGILHECAGRWDGQANRSDGETYLLTWKLPNTESQTDNEKNE